MKTFRYLGSNAVRFTALGAFLFVARTSPAQIRLDWVISGTNQSIQWPFTTNGYTLECSPVLGAGAQWTIAPIVTSVITNSSGASVITPSVAGSPTVFYRLHAAPVLNLTPASQILNQPCSVVVPEGASNVTFSVVTGNPAAVAYQWLQENGSGVFFTMAGQTNAQLILPVAGAFDNGARFRCIIIQGNQVAGFSTVATLKVVSASGATATVWGQGTVFNYSNVVDIATGDMDILVRDTNGVVTGYGDNSSGEINIPTQARGAFAIAAGYVHNVALTRNETVVAWGDDTYGQTDLPAGLSNIVRVAAGPYYSLALDCQGNITGWGYNLYGQLNVPSGLNNVLEIAAGGWHALALQADGTVVAWGANNLGQTDVPTDLVGVRKIAAGMSHSLALLNDGTVVAWGDNSSGQCDVPSGLDDVIDIAAGDNFSMARQADGTIITWGNNTYGELTVPAAAMKSSGIEGGGSYAVGLNDPVTAPLTTLKINTIIAFANSNTITLTFSGPVGYSSATNTANYTLLSTNTDAPAITVQCVTQPGSNTLTLVLSSPLQSGEPLSLVITGLTDSDGNAMTTVTVGIYPFTPYTPCAGGALIGKQVYSVTNADGFWHVVEDDTYLCPSNEVPTRFRVFDAATTQLCGDGQNPPSPVGLIYPNRVESGADCQSPVLLATIWVLEPQNGQWCYASYNVDQCVPGGIYYDGPIQFVVAQPATPANQPPPPAGQSLPK